MCVVETLRKYFYEVWRQHGSVVCMSDSQHSSPRFEFRSDHALHLLCSCNVRQFLSSLYQIFLGRICSLIWPPTAGSNYIMGACMHSVQFRHIIALKKACTISPKLQVFHPASLQQQVTKACIITNKMFCS